LRAQSIAPRAAPDATPIIGTDLYPTILAIAAVAPPPGRVLDGTDLTPVLRGTAGVPPRAFLFHQPHKWGPEGPGIEPFSAIRLGDWKLIWFHDDRGGAAPRLELYDAAHDCGECRERSAEQPAKVAELSRALREALRDMGAQWPVDRATGRAVSLVEPQR